MAKKNSYKILGNIYRGGAFLPRGSVVELPEEEADLYGNAVEKIEAVKKTRKPAVKKTPKKAKEVTEEAKEVTEEAKES